MKKLENRRGLTLLEMVATLLILVVLVSAVGTGMGAALGVYKEALFESNSASMARILNTALGDVLGYGQDLEGQDEIFRFTNLDYGVQSGYLDIQEGMLYLSQAGESQLLVNTGVYPDLEILNFQAVYVPAGTEKSLTLEDGTVISTHRGGYFYICYTIRSTQEEDRQRNVETVIRLVNEE